MFMAEGIEYLTDRVASKLENLNTPLIIAIAGGSCTGKTTVTRALCAAFPDKITVLAQDDYQLGFDLPSFEESPYRWDDPRNYCLDENKEALSALLADRSTIVPTFNLKLNKRVGSQIIHPKPIVVFEGLYALDQCFGNLSGIKVYVEAPFYVRFLRRIFRFTNEVSIGEGEVPVRHMATSVRLAHQHLVDPQRFSAELVLQSDYSFASETSVKYRLSDRMDSITSGLNKTLGLDQIEKSVCWSQELPGGIALMVVESQQNKHHPDGNRLNGGQVTVNGGQVNGGQVNGGQVTSKQFLVRHEGRYVFTAPITTEVAECLNLCNWMEE